MKLTKSYKKALIEGLETAKAVVEEKNKEVLKEYYTNPNKENLKALEPTTYSRHVLDHILEMITEAEEI